MVASDSAFDIRQYSPTVLLLVGIVTLVLLSVTFLVEFRLIIESPSYGDVTGTLQTFLRGLLGFATVGSFMIAMYNLISDSDSTGGPATGFEIKGENHDIDVHLHVSDLSEGGESEERNREVDEAGSNSDQEDGPVSEVEEEVVADGN